jgi:hypothetical protein
MAEMDSPFCATCLRASSPGSPGHIRTNQGIGKRFYGGADLCESCGARSRTLWWVFLLIPVLPLGSYRVIEFEEEAARHVSTTTFLSRRVPWQWPQILKTWALGGCAVLFLLWLIVSSASSRR